MSNVDLHWALSEKEVASRLGVDLNGLDSGEATRRLQRFGANSIAASAGGSAWRLLAGRFASPLVIILAVAALVSLLARQWLDAIIVLGIVVLTALLSFFQEYRASIAIEGLRRRVTVRANVLRDGALGWVPVEQVVPGDVVEISAGSLIPADALVLDCRDCFVNQALLTGETMPVAKSTASSEADASLAMRGNCVYMGTSVRSGWARLLVVDTGRQTIFGSIADRLALRAPETEFELGLRRFGSLLIRLMLTVVVVVLAINIFLQRPTVETLLFAAALAVGLSPELLPAILTITLARGARVMAAKGVIVKRLNAIESLGSMDVLCTDKTGTLTRGVVELDMVVDTAGQPATDVLALANLNASLQLGVRNPLDDAVVARARRDGIPDEGVRKLAEIPYDFVRRRVSVVVDRGDGLPIMIAKGAVEGMLEISTQARVGGTDRAIDEDLRAQLMQRFTQWSGQGFRVLALATRTVAVAADSSREAEQGMTLLGFLLFFDPPEPQVAGTLAALRDLGVDVKIITGDNRYVARHVADGIGMPVLGALTGQEMQRMSDEALWHAAPSTTLFTEIDPNQKERIILALQKSGHVVGYLGDGINDAPALHAADVGISVDTAVDVAREAADFVLLGHDLDILRQGIDEGRHTFANTLKYIHITTSANFGNMISMAVASIFLPFLPLLAKQILLNNLLSDIPAMGIAGDNVDREWERTPHRWDMGLIRRSMLVFGLISTGFDLITFVVLLALGDGNADVFRTGWFVESLLTELWILLVIRTWRPLWRSRPGRFLVWSAPAVMLVAVVLPYLSIGALFGFVPLPGRVMLAMLAITAAYVLVSETSKALFYGRAAK